MSKLLDMEQLRVREPAQPKPAAPAEPEEEPVYLGIDESQFEPQLVNALKGLERGRRLEISTVST